MNNGFITALISKKYNLSTNDHNDNQLVICLLLVIPGIDYEPVFCNIQAYILADIAEKVSDFCIKGEYLFLEGCVWTQVITNNTPQDNNTEHLLFIVSDMQPIF